MRSLSPWKMSSSITAPLVGGRRKLRCTGICVFFSITLRNRPPGMANPMGIESASTSVTESISDIDSASSAAPSATDSSGCTPLRGGRPKCWCVLPWTSGVRV